MVLTAAGSQPACVVEMSAGQEVAVSGRLDVNSVGEVRAALHAALDRGADDLLVHLEHAEVHDATGLGMIVGLHHRARRSGRRLVLVDVSARLDRLLRASHLHRVLARGSAQAVVPAVPGEFVALLPAALLPVSDPVAQGAGRPLPIPTRSGGSSDETVAPFTE